MIIPPNSSFFAYSTYTSWEFDFDAWIAQNQTLFYALLAVILIVFVFITWWCTCRFREFRDDTTKNCFQLASQISNDEISTETHHLLSENSRTQRIELLSGIACCVVIYAENSQEVNLNRLSFSGAQTVPMHLSIIVDGIPTLEEQHISSTFQALKHAYKIDTSAYGEDYGCRIYVAMRDTQISCKVYCKGVDCVRGKRQSHKIFFRMINDRIEKREIVKPFAIHMIDGDSGSPSGLSDQAKMFMLLMTNPTCAAVCSQIRPANHDYFNLLLSSQAVEYIFMFKFVFGAMSFFGGVSTAVGMSVMYRYNSLLEGMNLLLRLCHIPSFDIFSAFVLPDCLLKRFLVISFSNLLIAGRTYDNMSVLEKYISPSETFFDFIMLDMSEDFGLTIFLLTAGYDTMVSQLTHYYTYAPATWQEFFGQRRRWYAAGLVGNFTLVFVQSPFFLHLRHGRWLLWFYLLVSLFNMFLGAATAATIVVAYLTEALNDIFLPGSFVDVNAGFIAYGIVWLVLLIYFGLIFDTEVKDSVYILTTATAIAIVVAVINDVYSILTGECALVLVGIFVILVPSLLVADLRYWPNLIWGVLPYYSLVVFVYNIVLMFFVVANLDSVVWGTR